MYELQIGTYEGQSDTIMKSVTQSQKALNNPHRAFQVSQSCTRRNGHLATSRECLAHKNVTFLSSLYYSKSMILPAIIIQHYSKIPIHIEFKYVKNLAILPHLLAVLILKVYQALCSSGH